MSHIDPEQLALLALDEPVESPADREHLAACPECVADLTAMRHAATVGRAAIDDGLEAPPERVWERIADELGLAATVDAAPDAPAIDEAAAEPPARAVARRGSRTLWVLAASLAAVLAIGGGVWGALNAVRPAEIAEASLDAFPDHPGATGTATAEEERDGTVRLHVTLADADTTDAYHEVWLIRSDASALISLGILDGDSGTFTVPAGVDLSDFSLVDISAEPVDGDPQHSGDSIVRGELRSA